MLRLPVRRLEAGVGQDEDARCHGEDRIDLDPNTTFNIQLDNSVCRDIFA